MRFDNISSPIALASVLLLSFHAARLLSQSQIISIKAVDLSNRPILGVQFGIDSRPSNCSISGDNGMMLLEFIPGGIPTSTVELTILQPPKQFIFVSPMGGIFQLSRSEHQGLDTSTITLAKPGDKRILSSDSALYEITVQFLHRREAPTHKNPDIERGESIESLADRFGVTQTELNQAIIAWVHEPAKSERDRAVAELYDKHYLEAGRLFESRAKETKLTLAEDLGLEGNSWYGAGLYEKAYNAFEEALLYIPDDPNNLELAALSAEYAGEIDKADSAFERALKTVTNHTWLQEVRLHYADLLEKEKKYQSEQEILEEARSKINFVKDDVQQFYPIGEALGHFYERRQLYDKAAETYRENFMFYYDPREFPMVSGSDICSVVRVWNALEKHFDAQAVVIFLLQDEANDQDRDLMIKHAREDAQRCIADPVTSFH